MFWKWIRCNFKSCNSEEIKENIFSLNEGIIFKLHPEKSLLYGTFVSNCWGWSFRSFGGGKSLARTYNYQIRVHAFFISNGFFNSSSVLLSSLMNSAPNVAKVLLSTCRHHLNVTLFGFNIFVFMFTPWVYLCIIDVIHLLLSFSFDNAINQIILLKQTRFFFHSKVQPQGVAWLIFFCKFQPDVAYKLLLVKKYVT